MALGMYISVFILFVRFSSMLCDENEPMDIQSVNIKLLKLENEILRLKATVCRRDQELGDIAKLKETSIQTEATVNKLQKELSELRQTKTPSVAFRSVLSETTYQVSSGKTIVFDQVGLNIGDAYNPHNGIFTAPYNGTYIFSMVLGNPAGNPGAFFMVQSASNKREVIEYTIAGHTTGWNVGGVTTVTDLVAGDSVWVEGEGKVHGTYATDRYHTGFSGAMLHKQ